MAAREARFVERALGGDHRLADRRAAVGIESSDGRGRAFAIRRAHRHDGRQSASPRRRLNSYTPSSTGSS